MIPIAGWGATGVKYGLKYGDDVVGIVKGTGNATGQVHHILTNKTMKALDDHPTLKGKFNREDPIFKIFNGINLLNYVWKINAEDILYLENENLKQDFFEANVLNGGEFTKCISRDNYYMMFADIKAYPIGKEFAEIKTFDDFFESDCEIVLLCTDSTFIEFYCKDREVLDKVYSNCIGNEFEEVEYKTITDVSGRNLIA